MAPEHLERYLADMLDDQEAPFGYKSEKVDANIRLKDLVVRAHEQTGEKVVVIIDEYDARCSTWYTRRRACACKSVSTQ